MGSRLINPYTLYVGSFGGALLLYTTNWSGFYPPLQTSLIVFLLISFFLSLVAARKFISGIDWTAQSFPVERIRRMLYISGLLYVLWTIEFVHAEGVPLYMILAGKPFNYRLFGVPTLHVFLVTFSSFYTSYLLHVFLGCRKRVILVLYLANLFAALLILNRGMFLMNLSTSLFIFIYSRKSLDRVFTLRKAPLFAVAFVCLSLLFGVLGTLRVSHAVRFFYERYLVYEVGDATPSFKNSFIPPEFFWGYIYFTSPLANLQLTTRGTSPEVSFRNFWLWGTNEILLDAFSKRINAHLNLTRRHSPRIASHLNASTVYAGSYMYGGWFTMGLMTLVLLFLPFLYRRALAAGSKYFVTGMAVLSTLYLFLIFDNMLAFSGFSFQLVYPVLLSWLEKR